MSFSDYEAGVLARKRAAQPLADALVQHLPQLDPVEAERAARRILDDRSVYTANAYAARVAEIAALRDGLKAFKGLLDGD